MSDELQVSPGSFDIATPERQPITFDYTALMESGETITGATSGLVDKKSGTDASSALSGSPTVDNTGLLVTQWIDAGTLVSKEQYRLDIVATTTLGRRCAPYLILKMIF